MSTQCCDQYFVKYTATVVAMLVYAAPLWARDAGTRGSRDDLTQDYIRAMRLLQNTSRCGAARPLLPAAAWAMLCRICHWPLLTCVYCAVSCVKAQHDVLH